MSAHADPHRFQRLFDQAPEAQLVLSRTGKVVAANQAAQRLLGYAKGELTGGIHITELDLEATQSDVDRSHSHPDERLPARFESRYRRRDGSEFPAEININAIQTGDDIEILTTVRDITRQQRSEQALRTLETQLSATIRHAPMILFALDPDGIFTLSEGTALQSLGLAPGEVVGQDARTLYADHPAILAAIERAFAGERFQSEVKVGDNHFAISWMPMEIAQSPRRGVLGVAWDITSLRTAEATTASERDRLLTTLHSISDGVLTADTTGRLTYLNPSARDLLGVDATSVQGQALDELLELEDTHTGHRVLNPITKCLETGMTLESPERVLRRPDGAARVVRLLVSPLRRPDHHSEGVVVVLHDHTELWQMTQQLNHQATHDELTGLCNRREFERRLDEALRTLEEGDTPHALFYMDLDQFKIINDTCGHQAGDALLRELADLLPAHIRDSDTLARLGGDEFGLLLTHCPVGRAEAIGTKLLRAAQSLRFSWEGRRFDVGMSIGLVPIEGPGQNLTEILSQADSACYVAKDLGRNRLYTWKPSDQILRRRHGEMEWVGRLRAALEEARFVVFAQPVKPLNGADLPLDHVEILLRLHGEDGTLIAPGAFIPAAERYHLMPEIDRHVVELVFRQLTQYHSQHPDAAPVVVSINLSGQSLAQDGMLEFITSRMSQYHIQAQQLIFEITETAAISHHDRAQGLIRALRYIGCRFSLDDFGSGLSSFGYLKNLPVDFLKVDGSFVRDIATNAVDAAMVTAIHRVGHVLGLRTIAECVESEETMDHLREIGLDFVQGYHLAKPIPLADYLAGLGE